MSAPFSRLGLIVIGIFLGLSVDAQAQWRPAYGGYPGKRVFDRDEVRCISGLSINRGPIDIAMDAFIRDLTFDARWSATVNGANEVRDLWTKDVIAGDPESSGKDVLTEEGFFIVYSHIAQNSIDFSKKVARNLQLKTVNGWLVDWQFDGPSAKVAILDEDRSYFVTRKDGKRVFSMDLGLRFFAFIPPRDKAVMSHDITVKIWNGIGDPAKADSWRVSAVCNVTAKLPYSGFVDMQFDRDHNLYAHIDDKSTIETANGRGVLIKVEYRDAKPVVFEQTGWEVDKRLADEDPTGGSGFLDAFQQLQRSFSSGGNGVEKWLSL